MRIAISGAGIAGPTLAYWLHRTGHEANERAPRFRTGGYMIDFWGVGYTVAERMGVLPDVLKAGYSFKELRLLDRNGRRVGGLSTCPVGNSRELPCGAIVPPFSLFSALNSYPNPSRPTCRKSVPYCTTCSKIRVGGARKFSRRWKWWRTFISTVLTAPFSKSLPRR